jgi:hypothetical protein
LLPCLRIAIDLHAATKDHPSVALISAGRGGSFSSTASRADVSVIREAILYNSSFLVTIHQIRGGGLIVCR